MAGQKGVLRGHMARGERVLQEHLRLVDVVWELADARLPWTSRNPRFDRLIGQKPSILLLNKADLAAESMTQAWAGYFRGVGRVVQPLAAKEGRGIEALLQRTRELGGARTHRPLRAMVVGIPNVGKSSLLNRVAGTAKARTGARPGVTRGEQWLRLENMELLDLPGILPPHIRTVEQATKLTVIDALQTDAASNEEAAHWLVSYILLNHPRTLEVAYGVEEAGDPLEVLARIAAKRGALQNGGRPDLARASALVLKDYRAGRLGAITLEAPPTERAEQPPEEG